MCKLNVPAAFNTSKSVSIAHRFPGPGEYLSTAESTPDEHDDLNSASIKQFVYLSVSFYTN